uniref:Zn(2)-C6 fungal-type domain-containing protein n=1 Tax=Bionectria ochroleuca TaxID=29856 RepID=A0A8H7TSN8_BIOOC
MVGVPRSKGCHLCVKRRVKCDESKPQCHACVRYGVACPGYDRTVKFVNEKHQVRPRVKAKPRKPSSSPSSGSGAPSVASGAEDESPTTRPGNTSLSTTVVPSPTALSPTIDRAQFICTMLDTLYSTASRKEISFLNPWFDGIQDQFGAKATLDSAAASLILHMLGKATGDTRLVGESRSLYGQSLMALQSALNHKTEWKASETLSASTVLCLFELFAGTKSAVSWMEHAKGVTWLIQQRGPECFKDGWDRVTFKNFRALVIMNSIFSGEDCFLVQDKWQDVMMDGSAGSGRGMLVDALTAKRSKVADKYFALLAKIPSVLRRAYPLREARKKGWRDYLAFEKDMRQIVADPIDVPSQDPRSPFATVSWYENPWVGALHMGYWASMLIVQDKILRSFENVGGGIMGGYRVGYAMRVVYEFVDLPTQLWITSLLHDYEGTYAGLQVSAFPAPEHVEGNELLPKWLSQMRPEL